MEAGQNLVRARVACICLVFLEGLSGCGPLLGYQSPVLLRPGTTSRGIAVLGMTNLSHANGNAAMGDFWWRQSLGERIDGGLRLTIPGPGLAEVKLLVRKEHPAVALEVGGLFMPLPYGGVAALIVGGAKAWGGVRILSFPYSGEAFVQDKSRGTMNILALNPGRVLGGVFVGGTLGKEADFIPELACYLREGGTVHLVAGIGAAF